MNVRFSWLPLCGATRLRGITGCYAGREAAHQSDDGAELFRPENALPSPDPNTARKQTLESESNQTNLAGGEPRSDRRPHWRGPAGRRPPAAASRRRPAGEPLRALRRHSRAELPLPVASKQSEQSSAAVVGVGRLCRSTRRRRPSTPSAGPRCSRTRLRSRAGCRAIPQQRHLCLLAPHPVGPRTLGSGPFWQGSKTASPRTLITPQGRRAAGAEREAGQVGVP